MKSKNYEIYIPLTITAVLVFSVSGFAAQVIRKAAGPDPLSILPTVVQFTADLGGDSHGNGGSYTTGYRSIDWDEVPENVSLGLLPTDFYNTTAPRGVVLSSACSLDSLKVSATDNSGIPLYFGNYNANYSTDFRPFGGPRLFSVYFGNCNFVDFYFYIPGTKIPATVSGFGITFTDVDFSDTAGIQYFGIDGQPLGPRQNALQTNNGLSFVGVSYNAGERVARVRIFSGTGPLGENDRSRGGLNDIVVMDLAIYGEPRAIGQHSADFDGDGTADFSVFRPSNGYWYILQSGSSTFVSTQFGIAGDVPIDGDFDGDSRNDQAVFRPSTHTWYILRSRNNQVQAVPFGAAGDKPLGQDFDKDGISDISVWRPSDGNYYYLKSSNGQFTATHFGASGDIPIGFASQ
jgi:hypothetical protein